MRKIFLFVFILFCCCYTFSQAPYIATAGGDGLGQYGYLEKDAVTFSRLERNTYDNIAYLSARWFMNDNHPANGNGKEYIYHVYDGPDWVNGIGWQCGGDNYPSKRTTDFNAADFSPEWNAGADCYVSVCAKYCDNSYSPSSFDGVTTFGAVGFNERHFRVIDVDTSLHISTANNIPNTAGLCQTNNAFTVAGSFAINPGNFTGINLTTLIVKNNGSASEVTNIPNAALNVYYETATGTEVYGDGNETFAGTLAGNWDGNTADNIYGSTSFNIPLNGKIRVYVLLCSFNSPSADGKTMNLAVINDGIFLAPALDGFTKLRINASSISQKIITLPTRFLSLTGSRNNTQEVKLNWLSAISAEANNFIIQQSIDGIHFIDAGSISITNFVQLQQQFKFSVNTTADFFRVISVEKNGVKYFSNTIKVKYNETGRIRLLQNPVSNNIVLQNTSNTRSNFTAQLFDGAGKLLFSKNSIMNAGLSTINISSLAGQQILFLRLVDEKGHLQHFKIIKQ